MSRLFRLHVPDSVYYAVQRSNGGEPLFTEAADQLAFEELLARQLQTARAQLLAFCWDNDTIHLVLRVSRAPVGRIMQQVTAQYARWFHGKHGGRGHVFEGRYSSWLVEPEAYLLKLIRHVHLAPVRRGEGGDPADWSRSSHQAYLGLKGIPWLTTRLAEEMLGTDPLGVKEAYGRLMRTDAKENDIDFKRATEVDPRVLGSSQFTTSLPRGACVYRSTYSLDRAIDTVCSMLAVNRSEVLSRSRKRTLSLARILITWYAVERGAATLAQVARKLQRDPSTLFAGIERHRKLRPELFSLDAFQDSGPLLRIPDLGAATSASGGAAIPNAS